MLIPLLAGGNQGVVWLVLLLKESFGESRDVRAILELRFGDLGGFFEIAVSIK